MSQLSIEQAQNIMVMGKKASDLDVSTLLNMDDLGNWEMAFWEGFNKMFTAPEFDYVQKMQDVFDSEFVAKFTTRRAELQEAEKKAQTPAKITVNGKRYGVIQEFEVLRPHWEMDCTGWVVKTKEGKKIVLTNHGSKYFAEPGELESLMSYYSRIAEGMSAVLKLVSTPK